MLAIEIERRLRLKRRQQNIAENVVMENSVTNNNIDETVHKDGVDCSASNYDTSAAIDSLLDDNAQTHRDGELVKTAQDIALCIHSSSDESHVNDLHDGDDTIVPVTLASDSNVNSNTPKKQSPSFSLHSSPSVNALDESQNLSLYFTPTSGSGRESFSPIPYQKDQFSSARLIRSNSYTLDKPSPMLLKHMQNNGIKPTVNDSSLKSPMAVNRFRNNQNGTSSSIPRKFTMNSTVENSKQLSTRSSKGKTSIGTTKSPIPMQTTNNSMSPKFESLNNVTLRRSNSNKSTKELNKSTLKRQQVNPSSVFKNNESVLRSIYGHKQPTKVQHSAKKNTSSTSSSSSSDSATSSTMKPSHMHIINLTSNPCNNNNNSNLSTHEYGQILAMFEQQHAALLKRQKEEQKRMQEEFLRQQEELWQKMTTLIANKSDAHIITPNGSIDESLVEMPKKSNEKMLIDEVTNELPVIVDSNGNRVNRFTPESGRCIRRLRYDNQSSPSKLSTNGSEPFEMYTVEQVRAASIIVAHAKGFLTRRLLQTKKVLDLRKMHYDTLELLLDISEENNENESKSDVEFKFNLLQQVNWR